MKSIPAATPITLTKEEHAELEGLARSTKTEHRLRQRARIVLLSAAGLATRAIGREVGWFLQTVGANRRSERYRCAVTARTHPSAASRVDRKARPVNVPT